MRVAVIGSGIAGLAAAHALRRHARVTLFEASRHFGGHAHTVDLTLDGVTHGVDLGFLVFNHRTYPGLTRLFHKLGVRTPAADMSLSVQVPGAFGKGTLEWSGSSLATVFAQPANLLRPRFWGMLRELRRFNALATRLSRQGLDPHVSLGQFLDEHRFGQDFRDWYLLPMIGSIWSCPVREMLEFPAATLLHFCDNHGLLQVSDRPQWFTVEGGSREYVRRIVHTLQDARVATPVRRVERQGSGVRVSTDQATEYFDRAVVATHPDQALAMLANPSPGEQELLGAIRYQRNLAVLHTDASLLPQRRKAWAAWNHESSRGGEDPRVCLHYLINKLQPLPWDRPVIVSLNPVRLPDPAQVVLQQEFDHPVFDVQAIRAQAQLDRIQQDGPVWFCGAWTGYGFHEDGLQSGHAAASRVIASLARNAVGERLAA